MVKMSFIYCKITLLQKNALRRYYIQTMTGLSAISSTRPPLAPLPQNSQRSYAPDAATPKGCGPECTDCRKKLRPDEKDKSREKVNETIITIITQKETTFDDRETAFKAFDTVLNFNEERINKTADVLTKQRCEQRRNEINDVRKEFKKNNNLTFIGFIGWGEGGIPSTLEARQNISAVDGFLYLDETGEVHYQRLGSCLERFYEFLERPQNPNPDPDPEPTSVMTKLDKKSPTIMTDYGVDINIKTRTAYDLYTKKGTATDNGWVKLSKLTQIIDDKLLERFTQRIQASTSQRRSKTEESADYESAVKDVKDSPEWRIGECDEEEGELAEASKVSRSEKHQKPSRSLAWPNPSWTSLGCTDPGCTDPSCSDPNSKTYKPPSNQAEARSIQATTASVLRPLPSQPPYERRIEHYKNRIQELVLPIIQFDNNFHRWCREQNNANKFSTWLKDVNFNPIFQKTHIHGLPNAIEKLKISIQDSLEEDKLFFQNKESAIKIMTDVNNARVSLIGCLNGILRNRLDDELRKNLIELKDLLDNL